MSTSAPRSAGGTSRGGGRSGGGGGGGRSGGGGGGGGVNKFEEKERQELRPIADVILSKANKRYVKEGRRNVVGFRGKTMVKLMMDIDHRLLKDVTTPEDALRLGRRLMAAGFFHQAAPVPGNDKKWWAPVRGVTSFKADKDAKYVWDYEGSKTRTYVMLGLLVFVALGVCLFPVWPTSLRIGAWYFSVTFLLLLSGFLITRVLLFFVSWMFGWSVWILPNFFEDSPAFMDAFRPLISIERATPGQTMWRAAALVALFAFGYWVFTQPTEFDVILTQQKQFVTDLYSGALLSDTSQAHKDTLDEVKDKFDAFEAELNDGDDDDDDGDLPEHFFDDIVLDRDLDDDDDVDDELDVDAVRGADVVPPEEEIDGGDGDGNCDDVEE